MSKAKEPTVTVDAQLTDRRVRGGSGRRVLLVGEIGRQIRDELAERGVLLTLVATLGDGFAALENDFEVVVVNPLTDACGVDFVSALKEGPDEHEHTLATLFGARGNAAFLRGVALPTPGALEEARARHRSTPFVVLAADNSWHYAVVVRPPHVSFLQDARKKPLIATILTVDATSLLQACKTNLA